MVPTRARWWSRPRAASARPLHSERGFTLVEALIAAIVVTVALVALADLLAVSARMNRLGRTQTTAARLAQDKFEELMKLDFATSPAVQVSATDTLASNVADYFDTPAGTGYTRRWIVTAGPNPRLRVVTVLVVPEVAGAGTGRPYTLSSLLRSW